MLKNDNVVRVKTHKFSIMILVMMIFISAIMCYFTDNITEINAESNIRDNALQVVVPDGNENIIITSNVFRTYCENKVNKFLLQIDEIDFNYYKNNKALKKILDLCGEIANDDKPVEKWSDEVLLARVNIIITHFNMLEYRDDKKQLKDSLDKMVNSGITEDRRYSDNEAEKYNALIKEANSALNNLDVSEENVLKINKKINDFTNKYDDYPWWAWLIFCLLTVFPQLCFLVVVLCVPLWYCTFFTWWHTLLVLIPATVIVDVIIFLLHEEFC